MKKISAVILAVCALVFSLSSCAEEPKAFVLRPFSCQVFTATQNEAISGRLSFESPENIRFEIDKPENLKGLVIAADNGHDTVKIGSLETEFSSELLTGQKNVFKNLFEALGAAGNTQFALKSEGETVLSGQYEFGDYRLLISSSGGEIARLEAGGTVYDFASFEAAAD